MSGPYWENLNLAFLAGPVEFRNTVTEMLLGGNKDFWISFGQSMFRKIDSKGTVAGADVNIAMLISALRLYLSMVDRECISTLSVPKSFFPWLAEIISSADTNNCSLRGTSIAVAQLVVETLPQHAKSFEVVVAALVSELNRIASDLKMKKAVASEVVVQPDEIILHQIADFLKAIKDVKLNWLTGLTQAIPAVQTVVTHGDLFRPQCQVEVVQIQTKLFEIQESSPSCSVLTKDDIFSLLCAIIDQVRKSKVVHDAYQEAIAACIDMASALHLWTDIDLIACSTRCVEEIRSVVLRTEYDVKVIECHVGIIGALFEKFSACTHSGVDISETSSAILVNIELVVSAIRDLQGQLISFLASTKNNLGSVSAVKAAEKLDVVRTACADVRSSSISTAILITKTVPKWVAAAPELFWELSTVQLRTPLLFPHAVGDGTAYDVHLINKILYFLRNALSQVSKYSIKDASNLVSSISEIAATHNFVTYVATNSVAELSVELLRSFECNPRVPKKQEGEEIENSLVGWKITCCTSIANLVKALSTMSVGDIGTSSASAVQMISSDFCDLFLRTFVDMYITLHRACGLFGGPKGITVANRSRTSQKEAMKMVGTNNFDEIEPLLMAMSSTIMSFLDFLLEQTASIMNYTWWYEINYSWREYESINDVSILILFLKYCSSSLNRSLNFESDVDLICHDMELIGRVIDVLLKCSMCLLQRKVDGALEKTEVAKEKDLEKLEKLLSPCLPSGLKIYSVIVEAVTAIGRCMFSMRVSEQANLDSETRSVVFEAAKDNIRVIENFIHTFKTLAVNQSSLGISESSLNRSEPLNRLHREFQELLANESFENLSSDTSSKSARVSKKPSVSARGKHEGHNVPSSNEASGAVESCTVKKKKSQLLSLFIEITAV